MSGEAGISTYTNDYCLKDRLDRRKKTLGGVLKPCSAVYSA